MKLISMTDFVLEQVRKMESKELAYLKIFNYARFLKQPLTLGMFVPCDENGNVLVEPKIRFDGGYDIDEVKIYQQAKGRVLFEFQGGITLLRNRNNFFIIEDENGIYLRTLKLNTKNTIESLFKFSVVINLTPQQLNK